MPKYFGGVAGSAGVLVTSVFGRIGAVVATLGDYVASLVNNDSTVTGATVKDALNTLKAASGVSSVFGRTGAVVAAASDYNASQVDNDSTVTGTFVDDALDTLLGLINGLTTSDIANDSGVAGADATAALDALQDQLDDLAPELLLGSNITGNVTLTVAGGTRYKIPTGLGANITIHLSVAGPPRDNQTIVIDRIDTSAHTVTIINDGPLAGTLLVMPNSVEMGSGFTYAQGDWYPGGNYDLQ